MMDTHLIALQLMAVQGLLGAFDTLYHHELTEALPQRLSARKELSIHAIRALIYSALFIGLSCWQWHGLWSLVLLAVFAVEIVLTLWDFVIEDQTRLLPASERVTHTILAINGGAFIALLAINTPTWLSQPTALVYAPHGWLSAFLALCGVGVGLSGLRDALAFRNLSRLHKAANDGEPIHYGDTPETVLVTGATGFVGQLLVHSLLRDRKRVLVLTRRPRQAAWIFNGKVYCVEKMEDLPADYSIDVMVNLAGARILGWRWTAKRKAILQKSRVGVTQSLLDWVQRAERKPRLLISTSAIGYYGVQPRSDNSILDESSPSQPIFMSRLCQDWEHVARQVEKFDVRVVRIRLGFVLGNQGSLPMMLLPIKLGLGGPLGDGQQWLSWIHVQDVLRSISHVWCSRDKEHENQALSGAFNLTAPGAVSQREFAAIAAKIHGRPCFLSTPALPVRWLLGEQADLLLEGQRVAPSRLIATGFSFKYPELDVALKSL